MRPYELAHDAPPRRGEREQDDAFLDRMSGLLDAIVRECASIDRTEDAGAVLAKATSAFEGVQRMCREAGLVHADADATDERTPPKKHHMTRVVPVRSHELRHHQPQDAPVKPTSRELDLKFDDAASENGSLAPSTPLRYRLPLSTGEDIIEVEITDILTSTQEEIQRWKHEFRLQMMEQETAHHEQSRVHMEQIETLKDALSESQRHISKLARTIQDTNEKLESMQALTSKSQKAMELTLKEHTQYWKAICHDLVQEKRSLATKLAEERGKCHALREHMGMHDGIAKTDDSSSPPTYPSKAKRADAYPSTKTTTTTSYGASHYAATDHRVADGDAPQRASFRRYYLAKS